MSEAPRPSYADVDSVELVGIFYDTEGDLTVGKELSSRVFEHAGFSGELSTVPLVGRDGSQIQEDGRALMLIDYINFAARHHFDAVPAILDFLSMDKGSQDFETMRAVIVDRLGATDD